MDSSTDKMQSSKGECSADEQEMPIGGPRVVVKTEEEQQGLTDQVFCALGRLYVTGKSRIDSRIPETAAKRLIAIENAVDFKKISKAIDGRIEETVDYVKTTTAAVKDKVVDSAHKKVDEIVGLKDKVIVSAHKKVDDIISQPVVKDLVTPVTTAVVKGMLEAGDVIVDYALPEEGADEKTSDEKKEDVQASKLAKKIATRVRSRAVSVTESVSKTMSAKKAEIYDKVETVSSTISAKKDQIMSNVESATAAFDAGKAKIQVDLIAYAKGFLGDEYIKTGRSLVDSPKKLSKEKLDALQKFAVAVVDPYRQRLKGEWDSKISPVYLAVTDYGEFLMESVRDYEKGSRLGDETDSANDVVVDENALHKFISKVATQIVEPALVRTVAVFMVLGDEMRRLKVQTIEPNVESAKAQVKKTVNDVADKARAVIARGKSIDRDEVVAGLKMRLDGSVVKFEELKLKLTSHVRAELDAIVRPVQERIFAAVQALPWSGEKPVTIESLRVKLTEKVGEEYAKYETYITPLIAKIHRTILVAEEFYTPWYDTLKKTAFGETTASVEVEKKQA